MNEYTDYGRPMKPFFSEIPKVWAWADKFWGIFGRLISTHFSTVSRVNKGELVAMALFFG